MTDADDLEDLVDQLRREASNAMMARRHFSWMVLSSFSKSNIAHSFAGCSPVARSFRGQAKTA